ncbi:uncharacterized protein B0I36DRAFT_358600 [Microdochium trichocladiopsis]|uniref:Transcription factor domain-containing protein n=1 Tax=Microdochium trichocladiopsis TaxID=1682393 RepID=A0A9P9C0T2_9PEZI|nr:uncharacterized protein B0I36DRAFT_358600 [Microdochium trichocladiopsis]KAH7041429.1 hypothetical protein B0I36DRAFT_358600 [Microdochium trichocladiopsis]
MSTAPHPSAADMGTENITSMRAACFANDTKTKGGRHLQHSGPEGEDAAGNRHINNTISSPAALKAHVAHLEQQLVAAQTLLSSLGYASTDSVPSAMLTARAMLPPTPSAIEFELMTRFPAPFPVLDHTDSAMFDTFARTLSPGPRTSVTALPGPKPRDPRLKRLRLAPWLAAPVADGFAQALIAFYLDNDHLVFPFFDADVVLDGLAEGIPSDVCSPFLVAALLYMASLEYASIDPPAIRVSTIFLDEARRLWPRSPAPDTVATVSAYGLMSAALLFVGQDTLGLETATAGRAMAQRLGLFGVDPDGPQAAVRRLPLSTTGGEALRRRKWLRAAAHAAWGTYNWHTKLILFYHHPPILHPPGLSIPGDPPSRYTALTFVLSCGLWTIAHEVIAVYAANMAGAIAARAPLAFAEAKYRKLLAWTDSVDHGEQRQQGVRRGDESPADVLVFHMMFHFVVGKIWYPFLQVTPQPRLRSFASRDATPWHIYAASVNQLKDLILRYRASYPQSLFTPWYNPALFMLAGALLRDPLPPSPPGMSTTTTTTTTTTNTTMLQLSQQQERQEQQEQQKLSQAFLIRRSYLVLCLRCWQDLHVCYPKYRPVMRAFLALALQAGAISVAEARAHVAELDRRGAHHKHVRRQRQPQPQPRQPGERPHRGIGGRDEGSHQDESRSAAAGATARDDEELHAEGTIPGAEEAGRDGGGNARASSSRLDTEMHGAGAMATVTMTTTAEDETLPGATRKETAAGTATNPTALGGHEEDEEGEEVIVNATLVSEFDLPSAPRELSVRVMEEKFEELALFAEFTADQDLEVHGDQHQGGGGDQ